MSGGEEVRSPTSNRQSAIQFVPPVPKELLLEKSLELEYELDEISKFVYVEELLPPSP
jgi:hypothetical protein